MDSNSRSSAKDSENNMCHNGEVANKEVLETLQARQTFIGPNCPIFFRKMPLKIVRSDMEYLFDENGARFLDCINNVAHVGHCNRAVVDAVTTQMSTLNTNTRFLHDAISTLAARLVASTHPAGASHVSEEALSTAYFMNSGSEANDLALRLASYYTHNLDVLVLDHAYHGTVTSTMQISPYKWRDGASGVDAKPEWVHVVPVPDRFRGKHRRVIDDTHNTEDEEWLAEQYAAEVRVACKAARARTGRQSCVRAFIAESMQSCGGQIVYPKSFLERARDIVAEFGGILILDEVQVGFGRAGAPHFWAYQYYGGRLVPDILTMGKSMGNGHPVSAVLTSRAIARSYAEGPLFFSTFGGNPVSCVAALAVLDAIEHERLSENAAAVGAYLLKRFAQLAQRHRCIGDVRGVGLFLGIELVESSATSSLVPATALAARVLYKLREAPHRIIISSDGPDDNVLKFKPPMCFSLADAQLLVDALDNVLTELTS